MLQIPVATVKAGATSDTDLSADPRVTQLFHERYRAMCVRVDHMLARLMVVQWVASIVVAAWISPLAWAGKESALHAHLLASIVVGGAITSLPVWLAAKAPGEQSTRYVIAVGQVLWSTLLVHLTGGRIETHFHFFVSLAILAFYRDVRVLVPATIIVATDHFFRGLYWPESVYGVLNPEWWRFLEHAGWVVFLDSFLFLQCDRTYKELHQHCEQQIALEDATQARMERLAAIGQLAASVGHELRNPLGAIRNAHTYIDRRLGDDVDPKVRRFMGIISRELDASSKIIGNLLDFSRPRQPVLAPCPLRPLVDEAIGVVPARPQVNILNEVPEEMPVHDLDRDQFRQVFVNLIQNASEAYAEGAGGEIRISAEPAEEGAWVVSVADTADGMPPDVLARIFQPLFSTKVKGTGLGLAVVAGMVERHGGELTAESKIGEGTTFRLRLPVEARHSEGVPS